MAAGEGQVREALLAGGLRLWSGGGVQAAAVWGLCTWGPRQAPAVHTPFYQAHTPEVTGEKKVSGEESAQGACSAEQCGRAQPCGDSGDQGPSLRSVLSGCSKCHRMHSRFYFQ